MNKEFKELLDELKGKYPGNELHKLRADRACLKMAIMHVLLEYSGNEKRAIYWSELEDLSDCIACYVIGSGESDNLRSRL